MTPLKKPPKAIGAVLLMAGSGQRFGSHTPKQFHTLLGKKVYQYALDTLMNSQLFDEVVIVVHSDWIDESFSGVTVTKGGKTRQESVFLGLKAFKKKIDLVLIHDAARPFVSERIVKENILTAIEFGAANTCIPSTDTLVYAPTKTEIASIPKREEYLRGQTPQTFRMDWLMDAHEKALACGIENASDDCQLILRLGKKIHIVAGDESNIKITSEFDLLLAEQILRGCLTAS